MKNNHFRPKNGLKALNMRFILKTTNGKKAGDILISQPT